ncbi:sensor histidine kinase [Plantactinospora endophytica]|uniref:histidine kinase n=1 Tax=Plantactinospora endophytica TaxID=673535 RepID=A0ABQ4ECR7_9ACTN|nr:histidine kinase [Plantactinospora endophytica]GIG92071.1 hypothetical protein Pen02_70070 [Plantactinospora endophytica]
MAVDSGGVPGPVVGDAVVGPGGFHHLQLAAAVIVGGLSGVALYLLVSWLVERRRTDGAAEGRVAVAVMRERRRIAQELHDVVGHGLLVIAMHARQARPADPQLHSAFQAIDRTVQRTLGEMRRMLGVLHRAEPDPTPQPDPPARADDPSAAGRDNPPLTRLVSDLIAQLPAPGSTVAFEVVGPERDLAGTVLTTALRIVQEGLTNSLKHGRGQLTRVTIRFGVDLTVSVVTGVGADGERFRPGPVGIVGQAPDDVRRYGLAGLRERVVAHNGHFEYGSLRGGGFIVRARLPMRPIRPSAPAPRSPGAGERPDRLDPVSG